MTNVTELVFDPFSDSFYADPHGTFRWMREQAPVYYNPELDFYALTRHTDVVAAYRDHSTYSSAGGLDLEMMRSGQEPPKMILFMDPPEHGRMRSLVRNAFTPGAISAQHIVIADVIRQHLDAVASDRFDLVQDFAAPFPVEVVTRMTGVPEQFRQQVRAWSDEITRFKPGQVSRDTSANRAILELFTFYYNLVQQRRAEPENDMISALTQAEVDGGEGAASTLDDGEIASFAMLLGAAGAVTVTKLVSSLIALLAQHPDQWNALRDDPTKIRGAVEEALRFDGPILYNLRRTRVATTLHGVTIPAGKPVLLCTASANRDPAAFPDPEHFDIGRSFVGTPSLGMGYGIHNCLGAALARMEAAVALQQLLEFMPDYEVDWEGCRRVHSSNETGWSQLPVRLLK